MCAAGVEPNVITCNTVLSACQRAKLPHELLAIFGAMASLGVQPDAWGYSAAIHAFSQTGRMKQALELFHSMPREVPPSHHCFSAAMGACRHPNPNPDPNPNPKPNPNANPNANPNPNPNPNPKSSPNPSQVRAGGRRTTRGCSSSTHNCSPPARSQTHPTPRTLTLEP